MSVHGTSEFIKRNLFNGNCSMCLLYAAKAILEGISFSRKKVFGGTAVMKMRMTVMGVQVFFQIPFLICISECRNEVSFLKFKCGFFRFLDSKRCKYEHLQLIFLVIRRNRIEMKWFFIH